MKITVQETAKSPEELADWLSKDFNNHHSLCFHRKKDRGYNTYKYYIATRGLISYDVAEIFWPATVLLLDIWYYSDILFILQRYENSGGKEVDFQIPGIYAKYFNKKEVNGS